MHCHREPSDLIPILVVLEEIHIKAKGEAEEPVLDDVVVEVGKDIGSKGEVVATKHECWSNRKEKVHLVVQLEFVGSGNIEIEVTRKDEANVCVAAKTLFAYCGQIAV